MSMSGLKKACNTIIKRWKNLSLMPAFTALQSNAAQLVALKSVAKKGKTFCRYEGLRMLGCRAV